MLEIWGVIETYKFLANLTNITVSVFGLELLKSDLVFKNHNHPVKITNIDSTAVIYEVLATGVYWIHLDHV